MNQDKIKRLQAEEIANILTLFMVWILGSLIGADGITYMAAAASVCILTGILISGSLADALGRLLRSRRNKGQYKNILTMRKTALFFQGALGLVGTLLLILFAGEIGEKIFRIPYSTFILMALAPMVFLRTISCVLQGYFQGEGAELPRAVCAILRPMFTFGFGFLFGSLFGSYGEKVSGLLREEHYTPMYGCMGIAVGICLAEVFLLLFLWFLFRVSRRSERRMKQENIYAAGDSAWDCIREICGARWPHFLTLFLKFLPLAFGLALIGRWSAETGTAFVYDVYVGKYLVICGILLSVVSFLATPAGGRVFLHFRKEEGRQARTVCQGGLHICLVHGIFLSVYVAVLGEQIAGLLGGKDGELLAQMLQRGSGFIVFASLSLYLARILQTLGRKYYLLAAVGVGEAVFGATVILAKKTGLLAFVYGGVAGTAALGIAAGVILFLQLRMRMDWLSLLVVPLGAGALEGLVCLLFARFFTSLAGELGTLLSAFLISGLLYWILLLVLRNFREQELELFPGGRLLGKLGQMMHIYS